MPVPEGLGERSDRLLSRRGRRRTPRRRRRFQPPRWCTGPAGFKPPSEAAGRSARSYRASRAAAASACRSCARCVAMIFAVCGCMTPPGVCLLSTQRRRLAPIDSQVGSARILCYQQIALARSRSVPECGGRRPESRRQSRRHVTMDALAEPQPAGGLDDQLVTRLLLQRIIVLGAEVDDRIANRLCAQLLLLSAEDPRSDISLYINSPGGSVSAGLAIYDTMHLIPNDVSTLALGLAGSMAQFLLCAGARGKRFSLPHAQVLMHQGSAGFGGTAADVEIYAAQLDRVSDLMISLTAEHTGQARDRVRTDSLRDRWFSAEEALEYGMIDHIVSRVEDVRPTVIGRMARL
ncbi:MAG TPA: ATP-dependent Clp protease proteolytic subunit [Streptosporangiaceae bacterium]